MMIYQIDGIFLTITDGEIEKTYLPNSHSPKDLARKIEQYCQDNGIRSLDNLALIRFIGLRAIRWMN